MTTLIPPLSNRPLPNGPLSSRFLSVRGTAAGLRGLWQSFRDWYQRRDQLYRLLEKDDYMLRDIGLTHDDVRRALAMPFWHR